MPAERRSIRFWANSSASVLAHESVAYFATPLLVRVLRSLSLGTFFVSALEWLRSLDGLDSRMNLSGSLMAAIILAPWPSVNRFELRRTVRSDRVLTIIRLTGTPLRPVTENQLLPSGREAPAEEKPATTGAPLMHQASGSAGQCEAAAGNPHHNDPAHQAQNEADVNPCESSSTDMKWHDPAPSGTGSFEKRVIGVEPTTFTLAT